MRAVLQSPLLQPGARSGGQATRRQPAPTYQSKVWVPELQVLLRDSTSSHIHGKTENLNQCGGLSESGSPRLIGSGTIRRRGLGGVGVALAE